MSRITSDGNTFLAIIYYYNFVQIPHILSTSITTTRRYIKYYFIKYFIKYYFTIKFIYLYIFKNKSKKIRQDSFLCRTKYLSHNKIKVS